MPERMTGAFETSPPSVMSTMASRPLSATMIRSPPVVSDYSGRMLKTVSERLRIAAIAPLGDVDDSASPKLAHEQSSILRPLHVARMTKPIGVNLHSRGVEMRL